MKQLSALVISLLIVIALAMTKDARAYFELDERLIGKPTRTVLPDGRVHIKYQDKVMQPFPEGMKFPETVEGHSVFGEQTEPQDHYFNFRGEAVMQAHWRDFKLDDHVDAERIVCHDRGDKNMRLSLFGVSDQLRSALKNNMKSVFLYADANKHICHGDPIFRVISEVHEFGDEMLLMTGKPSYEDLFDEADVAFDLKHPKLTHWSNHRQVVEPDNHDHGVTPDDSHPTFPVPKSTKGSELIPARHDRMKPRDISEAEGYAANTQRPEEEQVEKLSEVEMKRKGRPQGWFKKLFKAVAKVVKKVVSVVKKAVSTVVKAVAKGIQVVKNVVKSIANFLTFSFEKNIDKHLTAAWGFKDREFSQLKGIKFTLDFKFVAGFRFHLKIYHAKLEIFHTSVYGSLHFAAGAKLPRKSYTSSGQSNLWDIPGTTITFAIGPIPVWISYSTRCIAGYTMSAGAEAEVGFQVDAAVELGVEYTSSNGFRPIATKEFKRTQTLNWAASFDAAPSVGAQARFALYSLVTGYGQLNIGLDVTLTSGTDTACKLLKINADFFIQISAGLDIELKLNLIVTKIDWSKSFGPWTIANFRWNVINVCKNTKSRLMALSAAEAAHLQELEASHHLLPQYTPDGKPVFRDASILSADALTEVTEADSGKVWDSSFQCGNNVTLDITATGFFQNDTTVMYVTVTRNITVPPSQYSNMTWTLFCQSALAVTNAGVQAGQTYNFTLLDATAQNAEDLGIDLNTLQALTQAHGDQNTTMIPLRYMDFTFAPGNMEQLTIAASALCPQNPSQARTTTNTLPQNSTQPAPPAEGSYFGRMFSNFAASLFPAFIRLITDVLVTVLVFALIEIAVSWWGAPRLIGEHWPKASTTQRTREWVYLATGIITGTLCWIIFVVGVNLTFAEITGAQLAPNFTAPVPANESSFLVASGVQTIVWKFSGASLELNKCPQYYPCSPDCRDLCNKQARTWTNAPWPYCGDDTVATDNGSCTKFAWDNILNAILFFVFLYIVPALIVKKGSNIYRRLPIMHASFMLAGMFLNLIVRRMTSFMNEVLLQMFAPADAMIIRFALAMNSSAIGAWNAATTIYWVMIGLLVIGCAYDIYTFYKDTVEDRIVKFDNDFEAGADYNKADSNNARPRGNTEFTKDVAADLANLGSVQESKINSNEAALM